MQGNDSFSNHLKKSEGRYSQSIESSLITLGRVQKLDLLIHLLTNLNQSLVVCGVKGIGKTTLLSELEQSKKDEWLIAKLSVSASLSYESVQKQLFQLVSQKTEAEYKDQQLSSILLRIEKQGQKVIVIIDDAGLLVSGLLGALIQFAESSNSLRFVFALTHDELQLKNVSDREIERCHFIEIPPLTERQCGFFLQNLSVKPESVLELDMINDELVSQLYQQTKGIPGEIVAELPKISSFNIRNKFKWTGIIFIIPITIGIISIVVDRDSHMDKAVVDKAPFVQENPETVEISSPIIMVAPPVDIDKKAVDILPLNKEANKDVLLLNNNDNIIINTENTENKKIEIITLRQVIEPVDTKIEEKSKSNIVETVAKEKKVTASTIEHEGKKPLVDEVVVIKQSVKTIKKDDSAWLLKQPEKYNTIQLMVLSEHRAVVNFIAKNQDLKSSLKYIHINKRGKSKYIIVFGSFKSVSESTSKMKSLPVKYRKSWIRKFKGLQKELKK